MNDTPVNDTSRTARDITGAVTAPSAGAQMLIKKIEDSRGWWTSDEHTTHDKIPNMTDMERDIIIAALRGGSSPVNDRAETYAQHIGRQDAEITRLRDALESIAKNTCCDRCQEAALVAKWALTSG